MKITKLGHSCFVAEPKEGVRVMTDPGQYSTLQNEEKNIDIILITHEHGDHCDLESIKKILSNNPNALVVTNNAVGKLLEGAGIKYEILEDKQSKEFAGIQIEAIGDAHAFTRSGVNPPQNTGYLIDKKLFYPGDSFTIPNKTIDILALPVAAPWLKIEEALQYTKQVNPKSAFPVHDGMLNEFGIQYLKANPIPALQAMGVDFRILELGKEEEF